MAGEVTLWFNRLPYTPFDAEVYRGSSARQIPALPLTVLADLAFLNAVAQPAGCRLGLARRASSGLGPTRLRRYRSARNAWRGLMVVYRSPVTVQTRYRRPLPPALGSSCSFCASHLHESSQRCKAQHEPALAAAWGAR
jgi:hypothetical protein